MNAFVKRNLKVYFRDKTSVFFSLLSVLIIIGLYVLFLGDVWASSDMFFGAPGVRVLMDSWIMAGLLAVVSITSTMGAFGIMVDDKVKKINKDFIAAPVTRRGIAGGYILSAFLIGVIMSFLTAAFALLYIVSRGGGPFEPLVLLKTAGLILLSTLANTSIVLFITSFFTSNNAFSTASTIIGTTIGFLTGIYMPIGQLPTAVQWVIKFVPTSHAAALFRQVIMEGPLSVTFASIPVVKADEFKELMGVTLKVGQTTVTPLMHILILLATCVIFYGLSILSLSRKKR
jgi:multidrug/hemolysin transport system permease protein